MAGKERTERGLTAESVLNNLQYIEGDNNKLQYLQHINRSGKFKKGEEESTRKSILLAQSKIMMSKGHAPHYDTYENWKKSGKGVDQLQNELIRRGKKNPYYSAGYALTGEVTGNYRDDALNLAIERGDIDQAVKLYGKCPVKFHHEDKNGRKAKFSYFVGLGNIYCALGQFGSAKEQYIKARNIAEKGDNERLREDYRGANIAWTPKSLSISHHANIGDLIKKVDSNMRKKILERRVSSVVAIAGFGAGIFFLQSNITGNAIADLTAKNTSFIGVGLLIIGLMAGFFWLKSKKK
jgi:tetratricopeptide (TPR) repeat protein